GGGLAAAGGAGPGGGGGRARGGGAGPRPGRGGGPAVMTATASPAGPASLARQRGPGVGAGWRRWRATVATVAIILAGGVVIAVLGAGPTATGQLDPRDVGPAGTHALAALLAGQGKRVSRVDTVAAALARSRERGTAVV